MPITVARTAPESLASYVRCLRDDAVTQHGVPEALADEAATITRTRFSHEFGEHLGARERRRTAAYFRGVVRRRAITSRGSDLSDLRSRFLLASLAADLKVTGRTDQEIYREIAQEYGGHVAPSALRALEDALCG
jgi:hypothetical protein